MTDRKMGSLDISVHHFSVSFGKASHRITAVESERIEACL
jgi:hypothetical protein